MRATPVRHRQDRDRRRRRGALRRGSNARKAVRPDARGGVPRDKARWCIGPAHWQTRRAEQRPIRQTPPRHAIRDLPVAYGARVEKLAATHRPRGARMAHQLVISGQCRELRVEITPQHAAALLASATHQSVQQETDALCPRSKHASRPPPARATPPSARADTRDR